MKAFFITGAGTDVGKTFIAAAICRMARRKGFSVTALKPVVSGFDPESNGSSDPAFLLAALGRPTTTAEIAVIAPWRFRAPLSPDMAAAREGRAVDFPALVDFCVEKAKGPEDVLLIEGVGGAMVPLTATQTVLDWMIALRLPAILVSGSYLGCLSHTLTAAAALRTAGIDIAAVVVSESEESPVPISETAATIARFLGPVPVVPMARGGDAAGEAALARALGLG